MNRQYLTLIVIMLISGAKQLAFSQDHSAKAGESNLWKWESGIDTNLIIVLGEDTLSPPPLSPDPDAGHWWDLFGYPELSSLTTLALEGNPEIKIGESRVNEAKAVTKLERSYLYPSLTFNPAFMRQEFSANRPMPFEAAPQSIINNTYTLPLDLSYEVDITGKNTNRAQASALNLQASASQQEALRLSLASRIARNFALLLMLDSENDILRRTLTTRQENLEIVKARHTAGLVNEIDLQRAQTEFSSVAVQLKNNQLQRTQVEMELATLCGVSASAFSLEKTGFQHLAPSVLPVNYDALKVNRPDIQAAEYALAANEKQVKSAQKELLPALYLNGSAGLLSGASENVFENDSRSWLIGATLSVPVFEGGRRRAALAITESRLLAATEQLKLEEIRANREVENALANLQRINEQLVVQQEFLTAAQKAADLSQQRYKKGLVTYLEVVDAERIVLEAERLLAQLLGQQLISTVDLIEASGGNISLL